jgi:hypothetical protein
MDNAERGYSTRRRKKNDINNTPAREDPFRVANFKYAMKEFYSDSVKYCTVEADQFGP